MSLLDTASLIVTPNGYKEGKLYSVIPSDGSGDLSVTRATTATRVNSSGLVELVPYNLMLSSEDFTTNWVASGCSVTANTTTAPNGTTTADTVTDSSTFGYVYLTSASVNTSQIVTHSVFLKRTNNDWINVSIARGGATTYGEFGVWFNLATGAIGSNFQAGAGVLVDSEITDQGNGWYRCSITGYVTNAVSYVPYVFNSNADNSFTSSSGQSRYQWGAQLNEGTLKDYQKTETRLNIPRLDYSNGTCPSILVEPQRTNLLTYSSSFDNSGAWGAIDTTISANTTASPNGNTDADTMAITSSTSRIFKYTALGSGTYTASIYVKSLSGTPTIQFRMVVDGVDITQSIPTTTDWVRHDFTFTASSSMDYFVIRGESGTGSVAIWGAQLEVGSYATSYIPTTSASVTRNADVISKTGISSLIGQTEGTIFGEFEVIPQKNDSMLCLIRDLAGGLYDDFFYIRASLGVPAVSVRQGATTYVAINGTTALSEGFHKFAFAYKQNDFAFYVDGQLIGTDTSGNVPTCNEVYLGNYLDGVDREVSKKSFALWTTRLTNAQLATLTTI